MVQTVVRIDVYLLPNTYVRSRIAQGILFTLLFTFVDCNGCDVLATEVWAAYNHDPITMAMCV